MSDKKLTGTLIPKDNKKAKMHATFYSDKPIGSGGDSEIFDEYIDATDAQRNTALANVSNQTVNSTTGKMGYKVLDHTKTFAEQVVDANTIYEIRDVFDLEGTQETPVSVTLPAGSTLKFNGGVIKNCNINAEDIEIDAPLVKIFDNVNFSGNCTNKEYKVEWFVDQYYTSYVSSPTKDAVSQFNQMFASGVKKVSFNDSSRFYNVNTTININGRVDICSKFDTYKPYDPASERYCTIYSTNPITIIDYFYEASGGVLNVNGLNLLNTYTASDSNFIEVSNIPLFYLHNKTSLWGVNIDVNIGGMSSLISPSVIGVTTATVNSINLYNFTGIKIVAEYSFISMVKIKGLVERTFYGIVTEIDKTHDPSNWFTDVVVDADTRCGYGVILNDSGYDRVYGSHQSMKVCNTTNNEAYIKFNSGEFNGYVWDIGLTTNGVRSQVNQYLITGYFDKTVGRKTVDNVNYDVVSSKNYEINNILPVGGCSNNALNRALSNVSCPNFLRSPDTTTLSFKASVYNSSTEEYGEEKNATTDDMADYYSLYYYHNLFGEYMQTNNLNSLLLVSRSFSGYYIGKQSAKIKFKLSFTVTRSQARHDLFMYIYSTVSSARNLKVTIGSTEYNLDTDSMQSYALRWKHLFSDSVTNVVITWESIISSDSYKTFPNIYIPNVENSFPALSNAYLDKNVPLGIISSFNIPSTVPIFNTTYNELCRFNGKRYVFFDGYTCASRKGSTSNRPTNLNTTDDKGFQYYDTTLNKYICWNGTTWINLDGTALS